jgi:hypothetical protein
LTVLDVRRPGVIYCFRRTDNVVRHGKSEQWTGFELSVADSRTLMELLAPLRRSAGDFG